MLIKLFNQNSEFMRVAKQMTYNKFAMGGLFIFVFLLLAVILAPVIAPYDPFMLNMNVRNQGPSMSHWFGTDELGRDIFSRILFAGRYSISMGLSATAFSFFWGVIIGAIAGYFGGWVDSVIMRFLDIIQAIPNLLLVIVVSAVLGPGFFNTIIALAVNGIPGSARMLRAQILRIREVEYIEAAQSINCSRIRIIFSHLLPNSIAPLIVQATMGIAGMISFAAALSFIGLGVQPPTPEWGAMLSASRQYIRDFPHMVIFPGLMIAITILALNLMGDGLRDALDPKLKR